MLSIYLRLPHTRFIIWKSRLLAMEKLIQVAPSLPKLQVEGVDFPSLTTLPGSSKAFFLAGAGVRGLEIAGTFVTFTAIGIYLDEEAVKALAARWAGRSADELAASPDFFRDIFAGAFDKFTRITMLKPLTGQQYSDKVGENCLAQWQAAGTLTDAETAAVGKFKEVFKPETFPPGSSILFTHAASGSLAIAFGEAERAVIENKPLSEAILESIIGEHGVSPAAKRSLALRISEVLKEPLGPEETKAVESIIGEHGGSPSEKGSLALPISEVLKEPLGPEETKTVDSVSV